MDALVHVLLQGLHVVEASTVEGLNAAQPVKEPRDPLQLGVLGAAAHGLGVGAEVDVVVDPGSLAHEVIEDAVVGDAGQLYGPATPPAAPLHVGAPCHVGRGSVDQSPTQLTFVGVAVAIFAGCVGVPVSRGGILAFGSADQGRGSPPPLGIGGGREGHVRIHLALVGRLVVVLVGLSKLSAGVGNGVSSIDHVPVVLVAHVVANGLLHGLGQEGCQIDTAIGQLLLAGVLSHKEPQPIHLVLHHAADAGNHVIQFVDGGGDPGGVGLFGDEDSVLPGSFQLWPFLFQLLCKVLQCFHLPTSWGGSRRRGWSGFWFWLWCR
mmetsp:Transcript_9888/g.60294  ORF Transcript_9888/g.60294 Transcript_9888/m.60294 type:complete len:321 (+) Transcript_9888:1865-2827(+)